MSLHLKPSLPRRIVCLTEETTETLYALGADDLIVGISGFTVRPAIARKTKPKVSTYLTANIDDILALKPDMVFAWSDLQADICAELIRAGVEVVCFNHRSIEGILSMILKVGTLVGHGAQAEQYMEQLLQTLHTAKAQSERLSRQPRVYFEEWYDPLITGICWVSELIELCGGIDVFAENRQFPDAKRRILADMTAPLHRKPDLMIASWCGKMFKPERVRAREHWSEAEFVQKNHLYEIHSSIILQPGPAALTDGTTALLGIFEQWDS
jgi:iron complex transport system substrate-binding protein